MITKKQMIDMRPDIENALKIVCEKYNVTFSLGSGSYGDDTFSYKLNGASLDPEEPMDIQTPASIEFKKQAGKYGLSPDLLWEIVNINGKPHRIVGLLPKSTKYPILTMRMSDGQAFKHTVDAIKNSK